MRFFKIRQDITIPYIIRFRDFDGEKGHKSFYLEDAPQLNDTSILYLTGTGDEIFPDFMENPVYLVSEKVWKIFELYEDDLDFKKVMFIHKEAKKQAKYAHLLTDRIEALSEKTVYYPDGREKEMILDQQKIGEHHIFQLKDSKLEAIFVSLAVAESLLRRNIQGILFEEVEVS